MLFMPPPSMQRVLMGIYAFIALCSLVGELHPALRRPEALRVRQAIHSWWPPSLVGGLVVLGGTPVALAVFCAVSAWTLHEYLRMLPPDGKNPVTETLAYLGVPLHYLALSTGSLPLFFGGIAAWAFLVLPLAHAMTRGAHGMMGFVPRVQWGVMLTVLGLSHVPLVLVRASTTMAAGTPGMVAFLLTLVMANDAGQYVVGKALGRTRLAPVLSPNKTWEGFAGGVVITGIVAASIAPNVTSMDALQGALVGSVLAGLGLAGDLLVSSIKRDAGVKDTGSALPGQGGVLDRCDSLLLTAPFFAFGVVPWLQ